MGLGRAEAIDTRKKKAVARRQGLHIDFGTSSVLLPRP